MNDRFDHLFVAPQDFEVSIQFYRDVLGWRVEFQWGGIGEPRGASLSGGGTAIVLAEPHDADDRSWSHGVNGTRPTVHLQVDDLASRYAELSGSGVIVVPPQETHWGSRWFVIRDPDHNLIAYEQQQPA